METNLSHLVTSAVLKNLCGRFVTVEFKKKDGTPTKRNGKLVQSPPSHKNHDHLFTLIQYVKGGTKYATLKSDNVLSISANKSKLIFKGQ